MTTVLVTGPTGFIGRALCRKLAAQGMRVRMAVRQANAVLPVKAESIPVGDIDATTDWHEALKGVDVVIHLAAIAHITGKKSDDVKTMIRRVNVEGVRQIAQTAASVGVRRFVFISSIKVNGEGRDQPYTEDDQPAPEDAYGISKKEAEALLKNMAGATPMEIVIIRPPLVYGPGVKANFKNLIKLAQSGLPLPLQSIHNRRSFVYVGNLADAISLCAVHPKACGQTFLVSDGEDISTPDLIQLMAHVMGKKSRLFSLPAGCIKAILGLAGKSQEWDKLSRSLCVDSRKIKAMLGWRPPYTLKTGIEETVRNTL